MGIPYFITAMNTTADFSVLQVDDCNFVSTVGSIPDTEFLNNWYEILLILNINRN